MLLNCKTYKLKEYQVPSSKNSFHYYLLVTMHNWIKYQVGSANDSNKITDANAIEYEMFKLIFVRI